MNNLVSSALFEVLWPPVRGAIVCVVVEVVKAVVKVVDGGRAATR